MNDYMITTDNNADLPEDFYKNHEVGCTYLSYTLEGKEYIEGNFLPVEEFYNKMRAGSMPTTSQVNPESARALFEPYLKDGRDILHIAFSSGLSGTFNSCRIAAEELMQEYPGRRVLVLDSLSASLGQGLLVYLAQYGLEIASAQDDGKYKNTWNENKDELEKATKVFQFYQDLIDNKIIDSSAKNWGWEETDENFATGITSTYVTGNWLAERESSNPDTMGDVSVAPIPYPADGQPATYMECKPMFIMEGSENKDEAFDLATAFCSKEWQEAAFADRSPRSDVSTDSKWSKDFSALADTGVTFPPVTLSGINQAMVDSIAKVLQEGKTAEEAASWLSDAVNASLQENGELSE